MGTRTVVRLLAVIGLSLTFAVAGATVSHASFAIGQTTGATDNCGSGQNFVQRSTAGAPSYVAQSPGVIVSWDYLAGANAPDIKLKVYALKTDPTVWTLRAESSRKTGGSGAGQVHANALNTFTESPGIPIAAGEHLGMTGFAGSSAMGCIEATGNSSDAVRVCCSMPGETVMGDNTFLGELPNTKADVRAVVEPDADGDLYGDETQDSCPGTAAVHTGACPADISVTKTASPEPVGVGGTLTYTITVRNVSPADPASNVAVNDPLPASVTFKSSATSQGLCSGTATVACSLGVLAPGGSATVTIAVTPTAAGPLANTATATGTDDGNAANNTATARSTVNAGTAPVLTKVRMTPTRFAVDGGGAPKTVVGTRAKKGTTFRYTLSEAARVRFVIHRQRPGRKRGKVCQKPTKSNRRGKRCTRYVKRGAFAQQSTAGANTRKWSGKLGKKPLQRGRYRATLTARDAAGNVSRPKRIRFRIVRR
jgi:uncharacterized repeat protein (TIGR01451 family)